MDSLIDGIITGSDEYNPIKSNSQINAGNAIWSEDNDDEFANLIESVVKNGYLEDSTDQHQDMINRAIGYMKNATNLSPIHSSIQSGLAKIQKSKPNWVPRPLTMGAFFFGAYLPKDKYTTANKYCDPTAAFSIPNFQDQNQVCESNVVFFRNQNVAVELNNNNSVCVVHLNSDHPSSLNAEQVTKLKSLGCAKIVVYKKGEKLMETSLQEVSQSIEFVPKWQFPSALTASQPNKGIIVIPSNVNQLNKNIEREIISQSGQSEPTQEYPGITVIAIILLLFIYLWVGQRALR